MEKTNTLAEKSNRSDEEEEKLASLRDRFTLALSADFQMSKLLPNWGLSPQPGSTYYLQKLSHDIFGIVNHSDGKSAIYIFDECCGPKNTDHTMSYLTHFLCESGEVPSWVRKVHNTSSTNKNCYTMGWANEMVQQGKFDFIRISFLIAGHTKFAPDLLFSKLSQTFTRSDIFTITELGKIAEQYAFVVIDEGERVYQWRSSLEKYSTLPGIRDLHDFIFVRQPGSDVKLKVCPLCYTGPISDSSFHVKRSYSLSESAIPSAAMSSGQIGSLLETKISHLRQMSDSFIPPERHLPLLN